MYIITPIKVINKTMAGKNAKIIIGFVFAIKSFLFITSSSMVSGIFTLNDMKDSQLEVSSSPPLFSLSVLRKRLALVRPVSFSSQIRV